MEKKRLTIVVPCKNEEEVLPEFYKKICEVKDSSLDAKVYAGILFIDDGSTDQTLRVIKELAAADDSIHYISFSRNFGKEAAMYAGLEKAKGDYVAVMDCDLQDPPALLPDMYRAIAEEGYDSVATRRVDRKGEPPIRSFFARKFYKIINRMSKTEIVDGARDFRLMTRQFVDSILSIREYNRFSKGIFGWVGFKNKWIAFENI